MGFKITVIGADARAEKKWVDELARALGSGADIRAEASSDGAEPGPVLFIDSGLKDLSGTLSAIDRRGRAVFLILPEGSEFPEALLARSVDDILVFPFRPLELQAKLHQYQRILLWEEVGRLNASFSELLARLHDDLRLAERLQKSRLPARFPEIRGFKASSRYLAGLRSGGDHFDLAESRDGSQLGIVLTDSSSYGLSSAVLSVLMKVALKLGTEEARSPAETVQRIYDELALTLKEKDRLSLFYGLVSRKDLTLRYLNLGSSRAFHCPQGGRFRALSTQGDPLTRASGFGKPMEGTLSLQPGDRLCLLSDGYIDACGGTESTLALLNRFSDREPMDAINEMVFTVKSKFAEPDDLPEQDCTAVMIEIDSKFLRLTKN